MRTYKNDGIMIYHIVKTYFTKMFKLKKGKSPFDKVGSAWRESEEKALIVFFGVRSALREKIASTFPQYRCAFAFGKTNPQRQLGFLKKNVPSLVVFTSSRIQLSPELGEFLAGNPTRIIQAADIQKSLLALQKLYISVDNGVQIFSDAVTGGADCFSGSIIYINIPKNIANVIAEEGKGQKAVFIDMFSDLEFDSIISKFDACQDIKAIYTLDGQNFLPELKKYCEQKNIVLSVVTEEMIVQRGFNPVFNDILVFNEETRFALVWNMEEYICARVVPCLSDYTVISVKSIVTYNNFCEMIKILSNKYSFTFFDYEDSMPDKIRIVAEKNNIPVYHLYEPVFGKLYNRKPFKNSLFVTASQYKPNSLGLPDRTTFLSQLDRKCDILNGDALFSHMRSLHALLLKGRKSPEQFVLDLQKERFILAVWHVEEAQELSFETFITEISDYIGQENIVCLVLNKGRATDKRSCVSGNIRHRTIFLRHAEDFDTLCPYAAEVHVVGSFYGFEALLAGRSVVTHGQPFYAGFGWTKDLVFSSPSCEQDFQSAALIALFGDNIAAPYTGESLSPDQALALHHLWLRSDFSYIFENVANNSGKDERYPYLDLRRKYYHMADPSTTLYILQNLSGSKLGLLLHDLFNFSYSCSGLESVLYMLPANAVFRLIVSISIYCKVNSLFDMLADIINKYVRWFYSRELTCQEIETFYDLYSMLQKYNRFREIDFPVFRYDSKYSPSVYKIYARISAYYCHYTEFSTFFDGLPEMPANFYSALLSYFMELPYGSREKDIWTRIELRQKIFSAWLDLVINDEKVSISKNSTLLIRSTLAEDLQQVQKYANAVLEEQNNGQKVTSSVGYMFLIILNACIQRCYYAEAELLLHILFKSNVDKSKYINQWKRMRKISDGFIPNGETSAKRKCKIEKNIQANCISCMKKTKLQDIYSHSWNIAVEKFYLKTSEIIAREPQPDNPRGYIFIPHFGLYQTAILPLIICSLAKRGYSSVILPINYLFIENGKSKFYKFLYSINDRPLHLSCSWEIDLENKKIIVFGMNLYDRFVEFIRIRLRIFSLDFKSPIIYSYLQQFIYQADIHLKVCNDIYQFQKKTGIKCLFLSSFLLILPQVVWFDFMNEKNTSLFRNIFCRTALTQKMEEGISMENVSVCAMDMAKYPDRRLPFLPDREKFQTWYKEFRKNPASGRILAEIRSNLCCSAPEGEGAQIHERLLMEKAAGKKIIFCYSRLLYDLSLRSADGGPGHSDMEDWLRHSIQIAAENEGIFLVIKPHPHEEEPEFAALPVEKLQDILPVLPKNVLLLSPRALKTPHLAGLADMVVLWLGTAIGELTALGIPVVVCSHAGVTDTPFDVRSFRDREDYARILKSASCPVPTQEERDIAAGLIKFSREGHMVTPYPYSFFSASNDFQSIPYYDDAAIERYFTEGDPLIEYIVDQILEGFETSPLFQA